MYDLLDLHSSLLTVAELTRSGMSDEAATLQAAIAEMADDEIGAMFQKSRDALAIDPAVSSKWLFFCMTALRTYEPHLGSFRVTLDQCLAEAILLFRSLGQNDAADAAKAMMAADYRPFYPIAPSCQIGILDGLYQRCFGRRPSGCFVEVGAFDGETFSNTSGLADLGWNGLYIEPMPGFFQRCQARHAGNPGIKTANVAIGEVPGHAFMVDEGALTQIGQTQRAGAVEVEIRRLDEVLADHLIPQGFDLLVVDVEGFEAQVFAGFDLARWRPDAILIELSELGTLGAEKRSIRDRILATGYRLMFQDAVNSLFVRTLAGSDEIQSSEPFVDPA